MRSKADCSELQAKIDAGAKPEDLGLRYLGSMHDRSLALLHPDVRARLLASGGALSEGDVATLKASPLFFQRGSA